MSRDWAESDFVRIYHSIKTDEKMKAVYGDKALLGWYVSLLLEAHSAFPQPAPIPRSLPARPLNQLAELGVIVVDGDFYAVPGLTKERAETTGRSGGIVRAATAERDEGGRFVAGVPFDPEPDDGREDIEAWVEVRRRPPTPRQKQVLDDILGRHDLTGPRWAADIILANPDDPLRAVMDADKTWRDERKRAAIADERQSEERHRRKPGLRDPLLQEIAATLAAKENDRVDALLQEA